MLDTQEPQSEVTLRKNEELINFLLTPATAIREQTEGLLTAPQLPDELIRRIKMTDVTPASGEDLKGTLLDYCSEINEATSHLILKATSGQMNMGFNVVGQRGAPLSVRIDEEDLGANEAERQLTILDIYWHLLGTVEGFKFIKRFYEPNARR